MVCVHTARSPERIWFMEYHWYEDYWDIPRRSPKGHVTGSGYYITGRLLKYKQPYIHTDQTAFSAPNCLTWGTGFFCTMRTGRSWKSSWEIIRSRSVHSRPPVICRAFCSPMDISNTQSYVKQQTGVGRLYSMPKFKHLS